MEIILKAYEILFNRLIGKENSLRDHTGEFYTPVRYQNNILEAEDDNSIYVFEYHPGWEGFVRNHLTGYPHVERRVQIFSDVNLFTGLCDKIRQPVYITDNGIRQKAYIDTFRISEDKGYFKTERKAISSVDGKTLTYKKDVELNPISVMIWLLVLQDPEKDWIFPYYRNDIRPSIIWVFLYHQYRDLANIIAEYFFPEHIHTGLFCCVSVSGNPSLST